MPTPIQTTSGWRNLLREFGIKGRHKLLLDEIVVPVAVLANFADDPPVPVDRYAQGGLPEDGAVATVPQVQVFNPVGSPVVLHVYAAMVSSFEADLGYRFGPTTAALPTEAGGQWQDRTLPAASVPVGVIQSSNLAAAATLVNPIHARALQNTTFYLRPLSVRLPAGTGWMVETSTVDINIVGSFLWFERDV